VPARVQNEWAKLAIYESLFMLLLERRWLDVAALGWREPDPALFCFARDFPMPFEDGAAESARDLFSMT
jgi:hypothetical protein